jgi:hypothetical protein
MFQGLSNPLINNANATAVGITASALAAAFTTLLPSTSVPGTYEGTSASPVGATQIITTVNYPAVLKHSANGEDTWPDSQLLIEVNRQLGATQGASQYNYRI